MKTLQKENRGMTLGIYINNSVAEGNLSQHLIAEKCGISQGTLSRIITGKRIPTMTTLSIIVKVLNLDIEKAIYLKSKAEYDRDNGVDSFEEYLKGVYLNEYTGS